MQWTNDSPFNKWCLKTGNPHLMMKRETVNLTDSGRIKKYNYMYNRCKHVKQMTSASLVHEVGHSKLVLCDNPEKWGCGRWEEGSG